MLPTLLYDNIETITKNNSEYTHKLFSLLEAREYISTLKKREYLEAFDALNQFKHKVDLFKLIYLIEEGGIYLNIESRCILPLTKLIVKKKDLIAINNFSIFIASKPNNAYLKGVLKAMLIDIRNRELVISWPTYQKNEDDEDDTVLLYPHNSRAMLRRKKHAIEKMLKGFNDSVSSTPQYNENYIKITAESPLHVTSLPRSDVEVWPDKIEKIGKTIKEQKIPTTLFCIFNNNSYVSEPAISSTLFVTRLQNPEYDIKIFTPDTALYYLEEHGLLKEKEGYEQTYNPDIFGLAYLWREGGVYITPKFLLRLPLSQIIFEEDEFVYAPTKTNFIASQPNSVIIQKALQLTLYKNKNKNNSIDRAINRVIGKGDFSPIKTNYTYLINNGIHRMYETVGSYMIDRGTLLGEELAIPYPIKKIKRVFEIPLFNKRTFTKKEVDLEWLFITGGILYFNADIVDTDIIEKKDTFVLTENWVACVPACGIIRDARLLNYPLRESLSAALNRELGYVEEFQLPTGVYRHHYRTTANNNSSKKNKNVLLVSISSGMRGNVGWLSESHKKLRDELLTEKKIIKEMVIYGKNERFLESLCALCCKSDEIDLSYNFDHICVVDGDVSMSAEDFEKHVALLTRYGGIVTSPAPLKELSIGTASDALSSGRISGSTLLEEKQPYVAYPDITVSKAVLNTDISVLPVSTLYESCVCFDAAPFRRHLQTKKLGNGTQTQTSMRTLLTYLLEEMAQVALMPVTVKLLINSTVSGDMDYYLKKTRGIDLTTLLFKDNDKIIDEERERE